MRKLFTALLLLALPVCALGQITQIAATSAYASSASSVTSPAINTTGATLIVVMCGGSAMASPSAGNSGTADTWNNVGVRGSSTTYYTDIFYAYAPTTSSSQTFHCSGSSGMLWIQVAVYSGTLTTSAVLQTSTGQTASGSTSTTPGSITPTQSGELFVSAAVNKDTSLSCTNANITGSLSDFGNSTCGLYTLATDAASYINSGTTAVNPTWTFTSSSGASASSTMAAFLPAASSPGVMLPMVESGFVFPVFDAWWDLAWVGDALWG
ncbi:MAG: hypothetical protein ACLQLH_03570 [Terracidiphilus sp.]